MPWKPWQHVRKDMIYRAGGDVKVLGDDIHSSGHAYKNDLQLMIDLLKPQYLVPVQGEYRLMAAHAEIAHEAGIPTANIFIVGMGDILRYEKVK